MARLVSCSPALVLAHFYHHLPHFISATIAVFSVFSFIAFLCLSNKKKKSLHGNKERIASQSQPFSRDTKLGSKLGCKAVALAKMAVSWRKVEEGGVEKDSSDEAVWRKGILMGERCTPLNFSGKIVYDSEGNQLLESYSSRSPSRSLVS